MTTASQSNVFSSEPVRMTRGWHVRQFIIYGLLVIGGLVVIIPFAWMVST
jgi:hypothetical protein